MKYIGDSVTINYPGHPAHGLTGTVAYVDTITPPIEQPADIHVQLDEPLQVGVTDEGVPVLRMLFILGEDRLEVVQPAVGAVS